MLPNTNLATKADIAKVEATLKADIAKVEATIAQSKEEVMKWVVFLFVLGVVALQTTLIVKLFS